MDFYGEGGRKNSTNLRAKFLEARVAHKPKPLPAKQAKVILAAKSTCQVSKMVGPKISNQASPHTRKCGKRGEGGS